MPNQREEIRDGLMQHMERAGTDVAQLSQQTGVSKDTIRRLLNEKAPNTEWKPNADTIRRICHRFAIHPAQLHNAFLELEQVPKDLNLDELEELARQSVIGAGTCAMSVLARGRNTALASAANPSTIADVEATAALFRVLAPGLEHVTRSIDSRWFLTAEELMSSTHEITTRTRERIAELVSDPRDQISSNTDLVKALRGRPRLGAIADGLDGTVPAEVGLRSSTSGVAIFWGPLPIVGAIYDPYAHEVFSAVNRPGEGAVGTRWTVGPGPQVSLSEQPRQEGDVGLTIAMHVTRSNAAVRKNFMQVVGNLPDKVDVQAMFALNSGLFALSRVGDISAYINPWSPKWDIAAAECIIRARGGVVTDFCGEPINYASDDERVSVLAACDEQTHHTLLTEACKPYLELAAQR